MSSVVVVLKEKRLKSGAYRLFWVTSTCLLARPDVCPQLSRRSVCVSLDPDNGQQLHHRQDQKVPKLISQQVHRIDLRLKDLTTFVLQDLQARSFASSSQRDQLVERITKLTKQYLRADSDTASELRVAIRIAARAWRTELYFDSLFTEYLKYSAEIYSDRLQLQLGQRIVSEDGYRMRNVGNTLTLCAHYGRYIAFLQDAAEQERYFIARYAPEDQLYQEFLNRLGDLGIKAIHGLAQAQEVTSQNRSTVLFIDSVNLRDATRNTRVNLNGLTIGVDSRTLDIIKTAQLSGMRVEVANDNWTEVDISNDMPDAQALTSVFSALLSDKIATNPAKWDRLKYLSRMISIDLWTSMPRKTKRIDWSALLDRLPETVAYVGTAVIVLDQGVAGILNRQSFLSLDSRISVIALILASLVVNIQRKLGSTKELADQVARLQGFGEELVPSSRDIDIRSLMRASREIKILSLAGTKLASLGSQEVMDLLLHTQKRVIVLLGDPRSEAIRLRYEHDEPNTYETGLDGIERRLKFLLEVTRQLPNRQKARFDVRVFSNYPTCSILQGDQDIYAIIYGYKLRGSDCPKIHTRVGSGLFAQFLTNNFERVYRDAMTIEDWASQNGF